MSQGTRKSKLNAGWRFGVPAILYVMFAIYGIVPPGSRAQSSPSPAPPSITGKSAEVNEEGYTLKPVGIATDKWPTVRVDFSIERGDKTLFRSLNVKDIEAILNKDGLALGDNSLRQNTSPTRILFMVDRSGSMLDTKQKIDKLRAAQEALNYMIGRLDANDVAAVDSFDSTQYTNVSPTNDKERLYSGIRAITVSNDPYTYLYDAIQNALTKAAKNNIGVVVVLSDGWEDTENTQELEAQGEEAELERIKLRREDGITRLAREKGIRVFNVAIGARGDRYKLGRSYVDYDSLCRISNATQGGFCKHVNLPQLQASAQGDIRMFNQLIEKDMKQILEEIRKSSKYAYSLDVDFPRNLKHEDGTLTLNFKVNDGRVKLPVIFPYTWDEKTGTPVFGPGTALDAIFIDIPISVDVSSQNLLEIYLILMLPIGLLALGPLAVERVMAMREIRRMNKSIIQVDQRSSLVGRQCPNELGEWGKRYAFRVGDPVIVCPDCGTSHHLSCWEFNGHRCMNRLCEYSVTVPAEVMAKYGIVTESRESLV